LRLGSLALEGAWTIEVEPLADERGFFARTFDRALLEEAGLVADFPQHSIAVNTHAGTIRGMHFTRAPFEETKIVRCTRGAAHDIIVDIRPTSASYRRSVAVELRGDNHRALYIPPGFAHGYQTLADDTEILYQIAPAYVPGYAAGLRFDDPALDLAWPLAVRVIAERDRTWPLLA
jgi:dTDP-4-dehydrorhamnose 3,5-epimerase